MIIRKGPPLPLCSHLYHIGYKLLWRFWHVFPLLDYESSRTRESVIFISCEYKYIHASYSIYFSCVFMSYLFQERFKVLLGFCWENLLLPVFTISVTSNHSSNCSIQKRRSHSSFLSLSLFLIQPSIKSCQFSFHYKSYIITSHHFTFTTYPGLQEQLPSCSPCILFCPLQFVFYRSAKPTLQTLN